MGLIPQVGDVTEKKYTSPKSIVIYGKPKTGKTTVASQLPQDKYLMVDLDNGAYFLDVVKTGAINTLSDFEQAVGELMMLNKDNGGKPLFKYGVIDTISKLEDLAISAGARLYKNSSIGKNWEGEDSDLLNLPRGAGYGYLRTAFIKMVDVLNTLFEHIIYIGHVKDSSISKNGKEVNVTDIDLIGKNKQLINSNVDAIAYMYREDDGLHITFKSSDEILCGSRTPNLRGKDILFADTDGSNAKWDLIFGKDL